jgi:hypothetical protein
MCHLSPPRFLHLTACAKLYRNKRRIGCVNQMIAAKKQRRLFCTQFEVCRLGTPVEQSAYPVYVSALISAYCYVPLFQINAPARSCSLRMATESGGRVIDGGEKIIPVSEAATNS